jgi:hypothetical protein
LPGTVQARPQSQSGAGPGADGFWSSLNWPGARYGHTAVRDAARDQVLVFGGYGGTYHNDVWILTTADPPRWTYLRPGGTAPGPRYTHSAILDPVRDRMIVFGGDNGAMLGDLWELSLSSAPAWSPIAATGPAPAARHRHTAVYDPPRGRMIVFGGRGDGGLLDDVWALSLSGVPAWTRILPAGAGPAPRYRHSAIYDPVRDRMIVFGGRGDSTTFGDAWALSLDGPPAWSEVAPGVSGPKRSSHVAVYDPAGDRMLAYGGDGASRNDAWSLSLTGSPAWSRLEPSGSSPMGHASHATILDAGRGRLVTFGGLNDAGLPTQELSFLGLTEPPAWSGVVQPLAPMDGAWDSAVYDPAGARLIVFGGMIGWDPNPSNEAWALALEPVMTWARIDPSGTPPIARKGHAAIYDPVRRSMVGFGGFAGPGGVFEPVLNDVWSLSTSESPPAWRSYSSFDPPSRSYSTPKAFYDPIRDRMIVYMSGFWDYTMPTPTVYAQSLKQNLGHWTPLFTSGNGPPSAEDPSVIYDPLRDRMIVFGGSEAPPSYVLMNDVWALSLANMMWSKLSPSGTPPEARYRHAAVYDPIRDRMVILGGKLVSGESDETWELSLAGPPAWRRLSLRPPLPPPLTRAAAVVVPGRDWIMMQGGFYGSSAENATWILEGGMPSAPACHCPEDQGWDASRSVSLRYAVSHPLAGERRLDWTLRSARNWPGFPKHGTIVVGVASSDSVGVVIAVPDSAEGSNRLTFETSFSGAGPDLVSCAHDLFDATATLGVLIDGRRFAGFALHGIRPNPSRGDVSVAFSLPASGRATLELYDVAGRRVSRRDLDLAEGSHVVTLGPGTRLSPGVFIVRLEFGGQVRTARGVRVR